MPGSKYAIFSFIYSMNTYYVPDTRHQVLDAGDPLVGNHIRSPFSWSLYSGLEKMGNKYGKYQIVKRDMQKIKIG